MEILLDPGRVAEEKAAPNEQRHPQQAAGQVKGEVDAVGHAPEAGDEWHEGPDDGNKSGQDDGGFAVALEKFVRPRDVMRFNEFVVRSQLGADGPADPVVHIIAKDRRSQQDEPNPHDFQRTERCHGPGRKEERVAREERRDDETRF